MDAIQVVNTDSELVLNDVPEPEIGSTDVLIEVEATSVGLTVYRNVHGRIVDGGTALPRIPGHEIVGRVAETGPSVSGWAEGDLVTTHYYLFCGACEMCLTAREPLCEELAGHVGVNIDGGYAERVSLPARNLVRLPAGIDPVEATVVPDAVATPYHVASRRASIEPGDEVMILGAGGGVGIHLVQMARYFGAEVTAVDQRTDKLERCLELGAVEAVDTRTESVADLDGTFDAIVDFTSAVELIEAAAGKIAPNGRLVILTSFEEPPITLPARHLVRRECEVLGSRYCSRAELARSAELVDEGVIEPIVTDVVDLEGVPELFDRIASGDHLGRGAVVP